jgi:hypothetical protein
VGMERKRTVCGTSPGAAMTTRQCCVPFKDVSYSLDRSQVLSSNTRVREEARYLWCGCVPRAHSVGGARGAERSEVYLRALDTLSTALQPALLRLLLLLRRMLHWAEDADHFFSPWPSAKVLKHPAAVDSATCAQT